MKNAIFFLLTAWLMAGCQTPHQFPNPTALWKNETGQLQYSNPRRSVIGDVEVTLEDGHDFQFDYSAGGGFPIMKLRQSENYARAEIAFAHISWQGRADRAPGRLKPWIALCEVFSKMTSRHSGSGHVTLHSDTPGFWNADGTLLGGRPKDLTVSFLRSKERFVFHFNR